MGIFRKTHLAVMTATATLLFTTTTVQAQGGIFDPHIPQAQPIGKQVYQPAQNQRQQYLATNGVSLQRASFSRPNHKQSWNQNAWDRVVNTYALPDYSRNPRVAKFIRSYSRNPKQLSILSTRADIFLHMIIEEVNRRGIPAEIALLPFVESGFNPDVFSHAGAAGLWQFIPSTGRNYGLRQSRNYDARMDPFAATGAALNYLQKLHREFKGDWLKALAAYNCGENCVHRAVKRARRAGKSDSYWNLSLPRETMQYVPRLLAFKELIGNARRYGIRLPATPNDAKLMQVRLDKPVNLRQVAQRAGLHRNTLTVLNPCFRKGITTPRYSNRIILPRKYAGRLIEVLRTIPPA